MKKRDRSINIFNLSMLDVISGALGAFLIVMVILMPYYNKTSIDLQRELVEQREQAADAERRAAEAQAQAEAAQQQAEAAAAQLANVRFMIFSIRWENRSHDVDLHVVDPSGAEFSYQQTTIPGRPGELTLDDTDGPGIEVWEIHDAPFGEYRFFLNLFSRNGNPENSSVDARFAFRDGVERFPTIQLAQEGQRVLVAVANVQEDGRVVLSVSPSGSARGAAGDRPA